MMIRKNGGHFEPFDRAKIVRSIVAAGESESVARTIADGIVPVDWMPTSEIRHKVRAELRRIGSPLSEEYGVTFKMAVYSDGGMAKGFAKMALADIARLQLVEEGVAELVSGWGVACRVHVRAGIVGHKRIFLSKNDARAIGLEEGAKISVRRKTREIPSAYLR